MITMILNIDISRPSVIRFKKIGKDIILLSEREIKRSFDSRAERVHLHREEMHITFFSGCVCRR